MPKDLPDRDGRLLGKSEDAERYAAEAAYVRDYINYHMFDPVTGYYYDLQTNADYHNGHTFHSFRVYDSALTPEILETITPENQWVELWYDFDKLTYLPAT